MITLTPEEEKYLVDYCMESKENARLAQAIGQIQPKLQKAIVSSPLFSPFFKDLGERVKEGLEKHGLHWKTCVPGENPEVRGGDDLYQMTNEDSKIEISLVCEQGELFVGTRAPNEACPTVDRLESFFKREKMEVNLSSNRYWCWWFYLERDHRSLEKLSTLHEDQELKRGEIDYLTNTLVLSAKAISTALEA